MAPSGRRRDVLDQHIDLAERIRKLEVMSSSLTLRPREWQTKDVATDVMAEVLAELIVEMSHWDSLTNSDPTAPTPTVTLSRRARELRRFLHTEGWQYNQGIARDWTRLLGAVRAIPYRFDLLPTTAADFDLYGMTGTFTQFLPAPVMGLEGGEGEDDAPLAQVVVLTDSSGTYDARYALHKKWLAYKGFGAGSWHWHNAGTQLGPAPIKAGQTGLPPVPDLGEVVGTDDYGPITVAAAGAYVFYKGMNTPLQFANADDSRFYFGSVDDIRSCENLEEGSDAFDNVPHYNGARPVGLPAPGSIHWTCRANLVDHEPDLGGSLFLYEYLPPADLLLIYPPMPARGMGGYGIREDFDWSADYPGWSTLVGLVDQLLPAFPGVLQWYAANIGRVRKPSPKWQEVPMFVRNDGLVEAQVRDRNVHLRGYAHRWATWTQNGLIGYLDSRYIPPPVQVPYYLVTQTATGNTVALDIRRENPPWSHFYALRVVHIAGEFISDENGFLEQGAKGGDESTKVYLDGLSYPTDLTLY